MHDHIASKSLMEWKTLRQVYVTHLDTDQESNKSNDPWRGEKMSDTLKVETFF